MNVISSFLSGIIYAVNLIIRKKLYAYFIPSIFLSLLFYMFFSGGRSIGDSISFMEEWKYIGWLVSSMKTAFLFISFFLFEFVVLVLLSPVNSLLAEKAHEDVTGEEIPFSFEVLVRSIGRMLLILLVALSMQLVLTIVLWLFSFLFGDTFFEITSMLNVAFFVGFSFFDFALELDEVKSRRSWKFARHNWIKCIFIGLLFNVGIYYPQKHDLLWIYLIGISILPHLLTIAASKMYHEKGRLGQPSKPKEEEIKKPNA